MCFARSVISSLGLKVQLPMLIEEDNKGAVDLINSWTETGSTRHIATRIIFLRELKEKGVIIVQWISNVGMSSDIFTKNVGGSEFYKHLDFYVRQNPSVQTTTVPVGEGVGSRVPSTIESKDAEADSAKGLATDTDSRKLILVAMWRVRPVAVQLLIRSTAPLLSSSINMGSCTFNPKELITDRAKHMFCTTSTAATTSSLQIRWRRGTLKFPTVPPT
jgi:hypothetical protein